jgi:putative transposase
MQIPLLPDPGAGRGTVPDIRVRPQGRNLALEARTTAWNQRHERVTYLLSSALLTQWKRSGDLGYLNEVSSVPLQQALRHLQSAFARFWDSQARYPRFKSRKKSRAAAEYTRSAFRCAAEPHPASATVVDAGITSLATLSTGEKIANPQHEQKDRARLARAQRRLSRAANGSANRDKARLRVARVSARNMVRNHHLARAISDAAWRQMRAMLEYKCQWYGRDLVVTGRWYPSSKTCSACGRTAASLPLGVREWACVSCGTRHDRDINAAVNIRAAGLAVLACGTGVRPAREPSRAGGRR